MTCHVHVWKNLTPFYWDYNDNSLTFALLISGSSVDISAIQNSNVVETKVTSKTSLNTKTLDQIRGCLRRSLGLHIDTSELLHIAKKMGSDYAELVKKGAGRLLRSPTLWEDAAKTLFTTNCSWALTKKMCESICSKAFAPPSPSGSYPFPQPHPISKIKSEKLKTLMPVGYRAEYLKLLAERFSIDPDLEEIQNDSYSHQEAKKIVGEFKGFGAYASTHLLVLSGYYNEIPIDTVVATYLKRIHRVRKPQSFIKRHYRKWGDYVWWGLKLEKIINGQNWIGD